MSKLKRFTAEQIVHKLREADVLIGQGLAVPEVIRRLEISDKTYYRWRKYNTIRPHKFIGLSSTSPQTDRAESAGRSAAEAGTLGASELAGGLTHGGRSGQSKVINEQAERYVIPFGGHAVNLPLLPKAIHDFLAHRSLTARLSGEPQS